MENLDLLPSVDALQEHLGAHDKAVRQIIALDEYIERQSEQSIQSTLDGQMSPSFKSMIRIAVAEGVKRMYKEYRLKKWLQVQEMASVVRRVLAFAGDDDLPVVPGMTPTGPPMPAQMTWQPPVPTSLPLLSPINTPHRMPGTSVNYNTAAVVSPAQHQNMFNMAPVSPRVLFPQEVYQTDEMADCADDVSEDSGVADEDLPAHSPAAPTTGQIQHTAPHPMAPHPMAPPQYPPVSYQPQTVPAGFSYHDNTQFQQPPQMDYFDSAVDSDEDDEDDMDWDEDEMGMDENLAGVLFAAEHLLPEQQMERLDVEMGDGGIGHILFDRVSATWYTHHCEFYRAG